MGRAICGHLSAPRRAEPHQRRPPRQPGARIYNRQQPYRTPAACPQVVSPTGQRDAGETKPRAVADVVILVDQAPDRPFPTLAQYRVYVWRRHRPGIGEDAVAVVGLIELHSGGTQRTAGSTKICAAVNIPPPCWRRRCSTCHRFVYIAAPQHRGRTMPSNNRLIAWIEPESGQEFQAAFVSAAMAARRRPATRRCASPAEARQWVEREAAALGVPVEWTDHSPRSARLD